MRSRLLISLKDCQHLIHTNGKLADFISDGLTPLLILKCTQSNIETTTESFQSIPQFACTGVLLNDFGDKGQIGIQFLRSFQEVFAPAAVSCEVVNIYRVVDKYG